MRFNRYADLLPSGVFVVLLGFVWILDHERAGRVDRQLLEAEQVAGWKISALAEETGKVVSERLGSLEGAKSAFVAAAGHGMDPDEEAMLLAALDSTTARLVGLNAITIIHPTTATLLRVPGTGMGRVIMLEDTVLQSAYLRSLARQQRTATKVVDYGRGRRVFVFDPIVNSDSTSVVGVVAAELDPHTLYRQATMALDLDALGPGATLHALFGPDSVPITTLQSIPRTWTTISRDIPIADMPWRIELSYQPPDLRSYQAERVALWVTGLALALAFASVLHLLRRTIRFQTREISRRQEAEAVARQAAAEARARAQEARELAAQLEAAHSASQRLSTSLDPDDVVELFLGGVAEILGADVASLYTFEDDGLFLVGRRRIIFRDVEGVTDRLAREDIRQVRVSVAQLPTVADVASAGAPLVLHGTSEDGWPLESGGADSGSSSVTVPLLVAGHTVGLASWAVCSEHRAFPPAIIAFAQALAAPAAAALRTAELFLSLEAERRVAAREAVRFGAVIDQMADGVIVVDENGRVERSNASAEQLLNGSMDGVPVDEWPDRFRLVSAERRTLDPSEFPLVRALGGESVRRSTFIVRSQSGPERHLSSSAGPIRTAAGEFAGAAMVLRDATDEHQYAEMLRHTNRELRRQAEVLEQVNHRLREATKAKDQFLAVMSHELRTPINAIIGYSDLLDLGVKGPLNDEQRGMLVRIHETSRHLLGLINEVLDLAKISAGRMDVMPVDLDVAVIVERAARQIQPQATAKRLTLDVEPPPDGQRVMARADETRLTQIIVNLLSNAVKFTHSGRVTLSYGASGDPGDDVVIRVTDTGQGVPSDQLERIFEEFYQVEGGLSRASGGTGLGLAIARRFARLMGGDIRVESEVGSGSTFTIALPGAPGARAESTVSDEATVVVLAHDKRALVRLAYELRGALRVVGTTEPSELVGLARRESPQLLAIDVLSPDHAGWRALAALQSEPSMGGMPLVLYAHQDEVAATAIDLGQVRAMATSLPVENATEAVLAVGNGTTPHRVLIAAENEDVRRIMCLALAAAGCEVLRAADAGSAIEAAREHRPDVAVIDLLMSDSTGLEAIAAMRRDAALRDTRIIVLVNPEMSIEKMALLTGSVDSFRRAHPTRLHSTADIVRAAVGAMATAS